MSQDLEKAAEKKVTHKEKFKGYINHIIPLYVHLIMADGIVDDAETEGFNSFLDEIEFDIKLKVNLLMKVRSAEKLASQMTHEQALENLMEAIKNEEYAFKEYLFIHLVLFGTIESINVSEQHYILKVMNYLQIEEHRAEHLIEEIYQFVHRNRKGKMKYFL